MMGRRRRILKQLLDDFKVTNGCGKLKQGALDISLWRTHFGRGYGPVVRRILILYFYIQIVVKRFWTVTSIHIFST